MGQRVTIDGNHACALVAYATSEVVAIYPITPASPMGELADAWANAGRPNLLGTVPRVIEMQSEGGAAGTVHGSLQAGALTTTFTASQGLLLMVPNLFKIAGELTPAVIHVAARSIATHALSIFGDHSDVMATRSTGWGLLCSDSPQAAHDIALIAVAATLESRVPFIHFFDGFRTSHELNTIDAMDDADMLALIDRDRIRDHRLRALDPDRPVLRGSAQNPDVFFQAREAANPFYDATPRIVQAAMDRFAQRTGRAYRLFEYAGHPEAERVVVLMGSGVGAAREAVAALTGRGERVGVLAVRLYRPFAAADLVLALPATARSIAVLDRTKEPGAPAEPLHLDVLAALADHWPRERPAPHVIGGRYGLSSKEFTPAMVASVFAHLDDAAPKPRFTVGIVDDVTNLSLDWDDTFTTEPADETRALFYGLGSDGTVGANKNSVKIIGEHTDLHAQGYFVYDSKKSGAVTVSHLRFGPRPIGSSYLIQEANFVACHQFHFLDRMDVLKAAGPGSTFLLNCPYGPDRAWEHLPREVQERIIDAGLHLYVVDAHAVANQAQLGGRINTIMQACFFAITDLLPTVDAIARIKDAIRATYGKRGEVIVQRNLEAVDLSIAALHEVPVPTEATATRRRQPPVPETAPDFVQRVTGMMLAGRGDLLPVSAMPADGTFPTGTSRFEKRSIAREIPIWDPDICVECGLCALVCPHAAIRTKLHDGDNGAPDRLPSRECTTREFAGKRLTVQVAPDDCTGCGICVDTCPAVSKEVAKHKSINMEPKDPHLERERRNFERFLELPELDRRDIRLDTIKGTQLLEPLFEFSGACAGCGETPYLKLLTQLFGDRILVANATGCSSIFGGNLPTTPWSPDRHGRGPAWSNSLFEDNAEFGLGMRLGLDGRTNETRRLLSALASTVGDDLARTLLDATVRSEAELAEQRHRVEALKAKLEGVDTTESRDLLALADCLVPRSVWIVGGDGWAYDIGFGGLDHVLASGRNVNILVLDTEVYSNTGGQASKATPRAAVAKFAAGGKAICKKDLGMIAAEYGNVYVAQIAFGANPQQTVRAFLEAESYDGPSLIIAYSHCIAHGIDMTTATHHQKEAVQCGYWPLYRYDPRHAHVGDHPMRLDSRRPKKTFREFASTEARFAMLARSNPAGADRLMELAQKDIDERWHFYEQLVGVERTVPEHAESHLEDVT